jgi:biopolymer transport protein ExbD
MRRAPEPEEPEGFSLTPMIDVTFQLIIFFMLVTDMAQRQLEPVTLPQARVLEIDPEPLRVVLNIEKSGRIKLQGRVLFDPAREEEPTRLVDLLEGHRLRRDRQSVPGHEDFVRYPVMIRADRSTEFQHLQRVLMIAAARGGVTKVEYAATEEAKP